MEEKKKDATLGESRGQKNRHGRRKGYFIEPAKPEGGQTVSILPSAAQNKEKAPAEKKAESESAQDKKHHGKRRPNRNRHDHNRKPNGAEEQQVPRDGQNPQPQNRNQNQSQNQKQKQKQNNNPQQKQNPPKEKREKEVNAPSEARNENQNRNRNRNRNRTRDRNRQTNRDDTLLTDTLMFAPSFFEKREEMKEEPEEEIIPYIPADDDDLSGKPAQKEAEGPLVEVVGIRFKPTGKVYYFNPGNIKLQKGSYAIVETARGQEYGEVAMGNTMVSEKDTVPPLRPVIRGATEADIRHHDENKKKE